MLLVDVLWLIGWVGQVADQVDKVSICPPLRGPETLTEMS